MNGCTEGDVANGQRVAGADRSIFARKQRCADLEAARSDNVATLAVGIAHQGDMRGTVGVVFEALDLGRDAVLVATEINQAVMLLMAAATMAHSDVAIVVAAGTASFLFEQ